MVVADAEQSLTITGNGDVLEPHDGIIGDELPNCCWVRLPQMQPLTRLLCSHRVWLAICSGSSQSAHRLRWPGRSRNWCGCCPEHLPASAGQSSG